MASLKEKAPVGMTKTGKQENKKRSGRKGKNAEPTNNSLKIWKKKFNRWKKP
ncbi:MAG: hypothetical protein ACOX22_09490 [Caldicoprobacterales bacterium]